MGDQKVALRRIENRDSIVVLISPKNYADNGSTWHGLCFAIEHLQHNVRSCEGLEP